MTKYFAENLPVESVRNFEPEKPLTGLSETSEPLAHALFDLLTAQSAFNCAKQSVPSYTGQHSDEDYYRSEKADFQVAAQNFEDAIVASYNNFRLKNRT